MQHFILKQCGPATAVYSLLSQPVIDYECRWLTSLLIDSPEPESPLVDDLGQKKFLVLLGWLKSGRAEAGCKSCLNTSSLFKHYL